MSIFSPLQKINLMSIIHEHVNSLYDAKNKSKTCNYNCDACKEKCKKGKDIFIFIISPFIIAAILFLFYPVIPSSVFQLLATVFTLFISLLLSLLLLLHSMFLKVDSNNTKYNQIVAIFKQTRANVSFIIFVSIIGLLLVFILAVLTPPTHAIISIVHGLDIFQIIKYFLLGFCSWIVYSLIFLAVLTILMVLKRVFSLLDLTMTKQTTKE